MAKKKAAAKSEAKTIQISAPKLRTSKFKIIGTSPYVQHKFSAKATAEMMEKMAAGGTASKKRKRDARNFDEDVKNATYTSVSESHLNGYIPATAIKAAMVAACRLVNFKMTESKQCFYVETDAYDKDDLTPLIKITKGKPKRFDQPVRNSNGSADIRCRPMWDPGWEATVSITYDSERFTDIDVANLLLRAGTQVGIGEGRQASRMCVGLGWGAFRLG
jgi:hypothetical protein